MILLSKFSKRKYHKGHRVEGVWVLGLVERSGLKKIKHITLNNRSKDILINLIKHHVKPDTIIYTDGWRGYIGLNEHLTDYKLVNHLKHFVDPITLVHPNTIRENWSGIKLHIPHNNRTKNKVYLYLIRYMILKNSSEHTLLLL